MYLSSLWKPFLVLVLLLPQYLALAKSSHLNESQFNRLSDEYLISGWKPSSDKKNKEKKASDKTIKALNIFKNKS